MAFSWIVFLGLVACALAGSDQQEAVGPAESAVITDSEAGEETGDAREERAVVQPTYAGYNQQYYNPYYATGTQYQGQYRYPYNYATGTQYQGQYRYPYNYATGTQYQGQYRYPHNYGTGAQTFVAPTYANGRYVNGRYVASNAYYNNGYNRHGTTGYRQGTHPYGHSYRYNYGVGTPYASWAYNVNTGATGSRYTHPTQQYPYNNRGQYYQGNYQPYNYASRYGTKSQYAYTG